MNTEWISPNDVKGETDSQRIQNAISEAVENGSRKVIIPRRNAISDTDIWNIDTTITLPGDIEILLDGAHLRQADNTFCQMFATENFFSPKQHNHLKNISICGQNGAVLDGGNYNGLSEKNYKNPGMPHIICNTMLVFYNTSHLTFSGIKIMHQRWWGITNMFVSDAHFSDLEFQADLSRMDKNGVHHPDEIPQSYEETYIKNADGMDLRLGCHNFTIENISGFTEDDTIALTALSGFEKTYLVPGADTDIHDITIRNVAADSYYCSAIRLLCSSEHRIYNISAENIKDTRTNPSYKATATVRLGDTDYTNQYAKPDNISQIKVNNIESSANAAVSVCHGVTGASFTNIKAKGIPFHIQNRARLYDVEVTVASE